MASNTPNVDLVPTSPSLVPPGELGGNETGFAIVRAFAKLPDYWDLVLVDTPPDAGAHDAGSACSEQWRGHPGRGPRARPARRQQRHRLDRPRTWPRQPAAGAARDRRLSRDNVEPCPGRRDSPPIGVRVGRPRRHDPRGHPERGSADGSTTDQPTRSEEPCGRRLSGCRHRTPRPDRRPSASVGRLGERSGSRHRG